MPRGDPFGFWMLLVFCAIGFAVAFVTLRVQLSEKADSELAGLSAQIGVGGGLLFWLILKLLGFGSGASIYALGQAVVRAFIWGFGAWPFTMWRLQRVLSLEQSRSYDLTTRICGVMLLLFFLLSSAAVIMTCL